jgi:hypothetical protein
VAYAAEDPPPYVTDAVADLLGLAYDTELGPRELAALDHAIGEEWRSRPGSRRDLEALAEVGPRLAHGEAAPSPDQLRAVRASIESSVERDAGPLSRWLAVFVESLEPLPVDGPGEVTGRQVLDLLWAASRLQAAGCGLPVRLQAAGGAHLSAIAEEVLAAEGGWAWMQASDAIAIAVARQFDGPEAADPRWVAAARELAHLPALDPPPDVATGDRAPSYSSDPWRRAVVSEQVHFWIPSDWRALPVEGEAMPPDGAALLLAGPGGEGGSAPLSEAIRVFAGPAPEALTASHEALGVEVRSRVESAGAEIAFAGLSPFGSAFCAGWTEDRLILYAAIVRGDSIIAARGAWPIAEFDTEACYLLFHRIWIGQRARDLPGPVASLERAREALLEVVGNRAPSPLGRIVDEAARP